MTFRDAMDRLLYDVKDEEEHDVEGNTELPEGEGDEQETTDQVSEPEAPSDDGSGTGEEEAEVKSTDDPEPAGTEAEDAAVEEVEVAAEATDAEEAEAVEDKDSEPQEDGSQTVIIDGEEFTHDELKQHLLRQADYTRKTQELAAQRKSLAEERETRQKLTKEIFADKSMSTLLQAHPHVLPTLLDEPENTRELLGNVEEIQKLWDQVDLLADHPEIAEKLAEARGNSEAAATVTAQAERTQMYENSMGVFNAVDQMIQEFASEFDGVKVSDVEDHLAGLASLPEGGFEKDFDGTVAAAGRLWTLLFEQVDDQTVRPKPGLIKKEFERLHATHALAKQEEDEVATTHNAQVDAALSKESVPATSAKGQPIPARGTLGDDLSFAERLERLRDGSPLE